MPRRERTDRTGAEKLRVVQEAARLDEAALGALLRREGLQLADLAAWRQAAEQALDAKPARPKAGPSVEAKRVHELERELARKERALAEAAALLVLKKKAHAIWGDADDPTPPKSGR
jgi:transposase-like protein